MPLASPIVTPERTAAFALNPQCVHPVSASSEYTTPVVDPMNTRPPTIVGCDRAIVTSPRLNAHFSLSVGTFEAVRPALRASWNRELVTLVLHPFQRGASCGL